MSEIFKTPACEAQAEIVEKKSRFIATLSHASSEAEALDFIKKIKKKYFDARHNCSAYIIGADKQILHSSDDGEPSGTAGKPMMSILAGNSLYNAVIVVTRYFGGTLLGTGGLVRAYSKAAEECIKNAKLLKMTYASQIKIEASYNDTGKLQYMFASDNITVLSSDYSDKVIFNLLVPAEKEESFIKAVTKATLGKSSAEILRRDYFEL